MGGGGNQQFLNQKPCDGTGLHDFIEQLSHLATEFYRNKIAQGKEKKGSFNAGRLLHLLRVTVNKRRLFFLNCKHLSWK